MTGTWLSGRRTAVLVVAWLIAVPAFVLYQAIAVMSAAGKSGGLAGFGVDIYYLYSWTAVGIWLGPPLLLIITWRWIRSRHQS
jgi:hypothetical protein